MFVILRSPQYISSENTCEKMDTLPTEFVTLQFPSSTEDSCKGISERLVPLEDFRGHLGDSEYGMCHADFPIGSLPIFISQYSAEEWDVLYAVSRGDLPLLAQSEWIIKLFKRYFREARSLLVRERLLQDCNSVAQQVDDLLMGKIKMMCCSEESTYRTVKSTLQGTDVIPFQAITINDRVSVVWMDHGIPVYLNGMEPHSPLKIQSLLAARLAVAHLLASSRGDAGWDVPDIASTVIYAKYSRRYAKLLQKTNNRGDYPRPTMKTDESIDFSLDEPELSRCIAGACYEMCKICPEGVNCVKKNPDTITRCACFHASDASRVPHNGRDSEIELEIRLSSLDELLYARASFENANRHRSVKLYPIDNLGIVRRSHSDEQYLAGLANISAGSLSVGGALRFYHISTDAILYAGFVSTR